MMLSENIREIRKSKGMTQEQLAEAMGVSTASVSKWETGQSAPELTVLMALADFFEVSVDTLLSHEVKADRKQSMLEEMEALADENRFDEAKEIARKLLRNYPNDYDVVQKVSNRYYQIYICTSDRSAMEYSIDLVRRLFALVDDPAGTKRFELLSRLGNRYELLGDWEMARKCYEEGNVAGVSDRALAHVLAHEKGDMQAAEAVSKVFVHSLFEMLWDVIRLQEIWEKLGQIEKARAALHWGILALEAAGADAMRTYASLGVVMRLKLASMDENAGENAWAEEHIRAAVRMLKGNAAAESSGFLTSNMPQMIGGAEIGSAEALLAMLRSTGQDRFAEVAVQEMNKV